MVNTLFKRTGAVSMVLLHLWTTVALAADVCPTTGGLGAIFSVLKEGKIQFEGDLGGECNILFYGSSSVNVQPPNLRTAGTTSGKECKAVVTEAESNTPGKLKASGLEVDPRVLDTYYESAATTIVDVDKNDSVKIDGVSVVFDAAGVGTLGTQPANIQKKNGKFYFSGAEYGTVRIGNFDGGNGVIFTRPVRIKTFAFTQTCNGGAGVMFAQDAAGGADADKKTFINQLVWKDGCDLSVAGPGRTTLNILGKDSGNNVVGLNFEQANPCVNYAPCNAALKTWAVMDAQHPERLQINIYNGSLLLKDRFSIAAGIYVPNGNLNMTGATGSSIVGEVLAKNIIGTQNNNSQFFSKSTAAPQLRTGAYSLTPPLTEEVTQTGSLVYRAMQSDYAADGKPGTSGHLQAFRLKADSSQEQNPQWDAAATANMTTAIRQARLYTESSNWLTSLDDFRLLDSGVALENCVINPTLAPCRIANDPRDPASLVGVPWRVVPILVGDSVLFATDDGVLYSVSKTTGRLNWGWIPSQILALTADVVGMSTRHPWGQIGAVEIQEDNGQGVMIKKTYVMGTALGGQLHFSIQVSDDGATLNKLAWSDYRQGEYSPGSAAAGWGSGVPGRPYGGSAPVPSFQNSSNKVAYIVGGKLAVRDTNITATVAPVTFRAAGSTESAPTALTALPTSNLLYVNDTEIYFGASDGKVYQSAVTGQIVGGDKSVDKVGLGTPAIWFINGTRVNSATGNGLMLMAQSERRVSMLRQLGGEWSFAWYTGLDANGFGESSGEAVEKISGLTTADHAFLSAPATINNNTVTLYYTTKAGDCDTRAYTFGPLKLADGSSGISGAEFRLAQITNLSNFIGHGESTGGAFTRFNGKDGVLAGSGGDGINGGDTAVITVPGNAFKERLNWRELTNFF